MYWSIMRWRELIKGPGGFFMSPAKLTRKFSIISQISQERAMRNFNILSLLLLAVLWTGLLLGVSFLATPVKFLAPSLSLPVALDVGRQTFMVFNWVEVAL